MSVLIKNMEMPESCIKCRLDLRTDVCRAFVEWRKKHPYSVIWTTDRLPDCPLLKLPEKHGDLIDRDAVKNAVYNQLCIKGEEYLLHTEKVVFKQIIEAEVVVEAEGEG